MVLLCLLWLRPGFRAWLFGRTGYLACCRRRRFDTRGRRLPNGLLDRFHVTWVFLNARLNGLIARLRCRPCNFWHGAFVALNDGCLRNRRLLCRRRWHLYMWWWRLPNSLLSRFHVLWAFLETPLTRFIAGLWYRSCDFRHGTFSVLNDGGLRCLHWLCWCRNNRGLLLAVRASDGAVLTVRAVLAIPRFNRWRGLRSGDWSGRFLAAGFNRFRSGLLCGANDFRHRAFVALRCDSGGYGRAGNSCRQRLFMFPAREARIWALLPIPRLGLRRELRSRNRRRSLEWLIAQCAMIPL